MQEHFPGQAPDRYAAPPTGYRPEPDPPTRHAGPPPIDPPSIATPSIAVPSMATPSIAVQPEVDLMHRNGGSPGLGLSDLPEPVFSPTAWLDAPSGTLADHPLLRGLLLELPPKGSVPPPGWLDRWFEAARSILELLYVQDAGRTR
jgi:hypothetical protein